MTEAVDTDLIVVEKAEEVITSAEWAARAFRRFYEETLRALDAGQFVKLVFDPVKKTRTLEQNALMWALLADVSRQVTWYGQKLATEEWKEVISASLRKQKVVPNIDGSGFVVLGLRTSRMSRKEMALMIEAVEAFGAQQGVKFSAPAWMYECLRK